MPRYSVGQPVRVSTTVRDVTDTLVNAGTIKLDVRKPDQTTQTYSSPTNPGTGLYHQDLPAADLTQVGHYEYWWTTTGTGAGVSPVDSFDVTAVAGNIVSLSDVRSFLNISTVSASLDTELRAFVATAEAVVQDIWGTITPTVRTEYHNGGKTCVWLQQRHVLSVTSVQETYGSTTQTLTEQPPGGATFGAYGYSIDTTTGTITRRVNGHASTFLCGQGNVKVVYTAGVSIVPDNVRLAILIVTEHLWQTQRGASGRPGLGGGDSQMVEQQLVLRGWAVPRRAVELLQADIPLNVA